MLKHGVSVLIQNYWVSDDKVLSELPNLCFCFLISVKSKARIRTKIIPTKPIHTDNDLENLFILITT